MKLSRCRQSHSVNALFSLEFHGAFSKCSTFAMSVFYSLVTAVRPGSPELALCPSHQITLSFLPALCYFSHKNSLPRHNLDMCEILFYTSLHVFLIFSIFVLNTVSWCLPKYAIHARHGVVTSPGLCVLHTTLSEKGSTLPWGQSVSDMPLYNMKPMYTRLSLKVHFTEILISISCFKNFFQK